LAAVGSVTRAGEPRPPYVPIPFAGNFEEAFKNRLREANATADLRRFFRQYKPDWSKLIIDEGLLQGQGDEVIKPPVLEKIKKTLKDMSSAGTHVPSLPRQGTATVAPVAPKQAPVLRPAEGTLDRWLRDLANSAHDSNFGSWLHDSPA